MPNSAAPSCRDPLAVDHPRHGRRGLVLCLLAFLALGMAWNLIVPPYENLDELEHAEVIRHIVTVGTLPIHGVAEDGGYHVRQEASQPPLYHLLAAGWQRILGFPSVSHDPEPIPGYLVACGLTDTIYNKATWRHDAYTPLSARPRAELAVHGTRALSTLLQVFTLLGVWTLARRGGFDAHAALLATAAVGLNPQFLLLSAGVNNDNAMIPLATWGLVVGYALWQRGPTWPRTLLMGLLSGLAALSKLSGLALIGVGAVALLFRIIERRTSIRQAAVQGLAMVAVAGLLVSPWMVRNIRLYGDPTALTPMLDIVGRRDGGIALGEARLMLRSYWGQLPCAFLSQCALLARVRLHGRWPDRRGCGVASNPAPVTHADRIVRHLVHRHYFGVGKVGLDDRRDRRSVALPGHSCPGVRVGRRLADDIAAPCPVVVGSVTHMVPGRPGLGLYEDAQPADSRTDPIDYTAAHSRFR